ncbi:MAG: FxsA family protein [Paracoccaceae bacterium]
MRILLLFIAWSLIEIALFVTLGGWLGLWLTLAWVIGTGMLGIGLIRWQGERVGMNLRQGMGAARNPFSGVAHSGLIMLAAMLLILPGFLTDAMGLLLLIPAVRRGVIAAIAARTTTAVRSAPMRGPMGGSQYDVIDAEVIEEVPMTKAPHKPSGWTQS